MSKRESKINFTVKTLAALPTPESGRREFWDENLDSFGLRVSSTGKRSWVVMYRLKGSTRVQRYTIGKYDHIPLAEARQVAKDVLHDASKGIDRAGQKTGARKAETFKQISDAYLQGWAIGPGGEEKPRKRSWQQDANLLKWHVLDAWGPLKANQIRRSDVKALLRSIKGPISANRVLALTRKIFNYALEEEIGDLEFNPCHMVRPVVDERKRAGQRVLSFDEIRKLWRALEQFENEDKEAVAIIKLRLMTMQRGAEIRCMEWSELDLETGWWTIPGERTKNKLDHRVPITEQVWKILEAFEHNRERSKFVFASPRKPNSPILNVKDPFERIRRASNIEKKFVMRDLRRTATSHCTGQLGISRSLVAKVLNHQEPGITKVYDRHSYDAEKTQTLKAWNLLLVKILSTSGADNVLMFGRTAN